MAPLSAFLLDRSDVFKASKYMPRAVITVSMDEELEQRLRANAEKLNQPISWYIRKILEQEVWPDRESESGSHVALAAPEKPKRAGAKP